MRDADRLSRELAAKSGGVLSREAARTVGLTGKVLVRRVAAGEWLTPSPRVLVLTGAPATFERDAFIAIADAGRDAAISTDTAIASWKIPGFALRPIHVSRGRAGGAAEVEGVVLHRPRMWPVAHRLLLDNLPIVSPTRALFDAANGGQVHPMKLERAINNAWARGLTSGERLTQMAKEWCERGRRGSAFIHAYLDRHPIAWQPPESNTEGRFVQIITDAGFPEPVRQRNVGDEASWIGRVDMCDPELPLIGEIDSDLFHTAPLDEESDEKRDARLNAAGFRVARFTEFEVWHDRDTVITRWAEERRLARARQRRSA